MPIVQVLGLMANGHGGVRPGAGRKPVKLEDADAAAALLTAAVYELAIGQSSVKLELDSKSQVKPTVSAYHRDVKKAAELAEAEFDRLLLKYCKAPETK